MTSEKFCLKWNDFESNISVSFKSIREDKELFDVTLACDDNQIQAHKLILSACSPFFRDVFRRNPHQHPLLYLRGIKYRDIESILQFMYHGEVNVAQEDLNNFLSISEELRVKGLTQGKDEKTDPVKQPSPSVSSVPRQAQSNKSSVRSVTERMQYQEEEDEIEEIIPIKSEPVPSHESLGQAVTQVDVNPPGGYDENYEEYAAYDEANYTVDATEGNKGSEFQCIEDFDRLIVKDGPDKVCSLCGVFRNKTITNVRCHIEAKHFHGLFSYTCDRCDKVCKTKFAFSQHLRNCQRNELI